MTKEFRLTAIIITLSFFLIFSLNGCKNESDIQQPSQIKEDVKEVKSFIVPQHELVETPKYKELKQKVETAQSVVRDIKNKRNELLVIYTSEYVAKKKISADLNKAEKNLAELRSLLKAEEENLERRIKNSSV